MPSYALPQPLYSSEELNPVGSRVPPDSPPGRGEPPRALPPPAPAARAPLGGPEPAANQHQQSSSSADKLAVAKEAALRRAAELAAQPSAGPSDAEPAGHAANGAVPVQQQAPAPPTQPPAALPQPPSGAPQQQGRMPPPSAQQPEPPMRIPKPGAASTRPLARVRPPPAPAPHARAETQEPPLRMPKPTAGEAYAPKETLPPPAHAQKPATPAQGPQPRAPPAPAPQQPVVHRVQVRQAPAEELKPLRVPKGASSTSIIGSTSGGVPECCTAVVLLARWHAVNEHIDAVTVARWRRCYPRAACTSCAC
jgi:hypothetical protein